MVNKSQMPRFGWTTGTCATAAAVAAELLRDNGTSRNKVSVTLPHGKLARLPIKQSKQTSTGSYACVIKDAGDDPDVTNGTLVECWIKPNEKGQGLSFHGGEGVGTITLPGLALDVGEPAINPVPRAMITENLAALHGGKVPDLDITIGIRNGQEIAKKTLNARLGIVGGLSILGTTGIVVPFSCAAWIETIHRSIDVAKKMGHTHLIGATGDTSARCAQNLYHLPDLCMIEMGDFVGGFLKYLRRHPVRRITIAGGPGKITKIAQGFKDLRAVKHAVDRDAFSRLLDLCPFDDALKIQLQTQPTIAQMFKLLSVHQSSILGNLIARQAYLKSKAMLNVGNSKLDVIIFDRLGKILGRYPQTLL